MTGATPEKTVAGSKCGIVRPIAEIDGYSAAHWQDVHDIVAEALASEGFEVSLVSHSDGIGVIHGRIVKNLYDNDLVVCDVSGKNPNVMFELGMRLAFDKPTIVIKDDATAYSFDTAPIEHVPYPRDLRYQPMLDFKAELARKAKATLAAPNDPGYKSFLGHFGPIKVATIDHQEVTPDQLIMEELRDLRRMVGRLQDTSVIQTTGGLSQYVSFDISGLGSAEMTKVVREIAALEVVHVKGPIELGRSLEAAFPIGLAAAKRNIIMFKIAQIIDKAKAA